MSLTYGVGDPDPTPKIGPTCDTLQSGVSCTWRPEHTGDHVAGNSDTILAVWPNTEQPTRRPHMTYREAAEVIMAPSHPFFLRAVKVLAELGARTEGPERPAVVGTRLHSWAAIEDLPVGAFVRLANGDRGVRAEDTTGPGLLGPRPADDRSADRLPDTARLNSQWSAQWTA